MPARPRTAAPLSDIKLWLQYSREDSAVAGRIWTLQRGALARTYKEIHAHPSRSVSDRRHCRTSIHDRTAAVSWSARLGHLHLEGSWLAWLELAADAYLFTLAAVGELIADQLPKTPSRKAPPGFITRILSAPCAAPHSVSMAVR